MDQEDQYLQTESDTASPNARRSAPAAIWAPCEHDTASDACGPDEPSFHNREDGQTFGSSQDFARDGLQSLYMSA